MCIKEFKKELNEINENLCLDTYEDTDKPREKKTEPVIIRRVTDEEKTLLGIASDAILALKNLME